MNALLLGVLLMATPPVTPNGAKGNGVTDDRAALAAANGFAVGLGTDLRLPGGTYRIASDLDLDTVVFMPGAALVPDDGVSVSVALPLGFSPMADIRWFGAVSGQDATKAIQRAAAALSAAGGGRLLVPRGLWYYAGGQCVLGDGVEVVGEGRESIIHVNGLLPDLRLFYAAGTQSVKTNLDADTAVDDITVTLPSGAGASYAAGDYIAFESTAVVYGTFGKALEIRKVMDVSGDDVTLDTNLAFAYLVADSAQFWKMTPVRGVALRNLAFTYDNPTTNRGYVMRLRETADCTIENVWIQDGGGGVLWTNVQNGSIDDLTIDSLPNYADSLGYGVAIAGASTRITINGLKGGDCRHLFTTLADERTGVFWGGPQWVTINGGVATGSDGGFSSWDTHEFGMQIAFNGCQQFGGGSLVSGYQIRAKFVYLNNCSSYLAGLRAIHIDDLASDIQVNGGEFAFAATNGVSIQAPNTTIEGAKIHDCGNAGVVLVSGVPGICIRDNDIHDNGQVTSGYAIQDQGATTPIITGNTIPYSAAQAISVLNLSAGAVFSGNVCRGFGATGQLGLSGPSASAIVANNIGDGGDGVSADVGDAGITVYAGSTAPVILYNTPITNNRAVTLSTTNIWNGARFRVLRTAAATGAFSVNVGTGPLKALVAGSWCDVEYTGAAWILTGYGTL